MLESGAPINQIWQSLEEGHGAGKRCSDQPDLAEFGGRPRCWKAVLRSTRSGRVWRKATVLESGAPINQIWQSLEEGHGAGKRCSDQPNLAEFGGRPRCWKAVLRSEEHYVSKGNTT